MASVPQDGDDFDTDGTTGQTDDWTVRVDVFSVGLSFRVTNGNAKLVEESCNCDISDDVCRHVAIAEGRVRAVFNDESLDGVKGKVTQAPALWRPICEDDGVEASDTHL